MSFFPNRAVNNQGKKNYRPNLVSLMTLCANNYMLLLKVLAGKTVVGDVRHFFISDLLAYSVSVKEVTRYTSVISFEQDSLNLSANDNIPNIVVNALHPRMTIRLYHDARVAEVLSTQDIRQVKPRYDYPNIHMHQQDEKQQINQFLNEWLHLCLHLGQVNIELRA